MALAIEPGRVERVSDGVADGLVKHRVGVGRLVDVGRLRLCDIDCSGSLPENG